MSALHVEITGAGPALVLLHGWGLNLRVFDALRARLQHDYTLHCIDLPGHGRSPWQPEYRSLDAQLDALLAVLPPQASVLGWSLGGQFALQLAAATHTGIRRLVLLATTPRFVQAADWPQALAPQALERVAQQLGTDYHQTVADFLELQVRGSAASAQALAQLRHALEAHGEAAPEALATGLELLQNNDLRALCAHCALPALVVSGQYDRIAPPAAGQALARMMPRALYLELRRAGHVPQLSHVDELVLALHGFMDAAAPGVRIPVAAPVFP